MKANKSVSQWIPGVRRGDQQAAARLWQRYYRRLVTLARRRMRSGKNVLCDEEDIAAQAFHSFLQRARSGRFPDIQDRDDLWRILSSITCRKVINEMRYARREKRHTLRTATETNGEKADYISNLSAPAMDAAYVETRSELLELLEPELRHIALAKLHGYTNVEIAARVRRSVPTVERRLRLIREIWRQQQQVPYEEPWT